MPVGTSTENPNSKPPIVVQQFSCDSPILPRRGGVGKGLRLLLGASGDYVGVNSGEDVEHAAKSQAQLYAEGASCRDLGCKCETNTNLVRMSGSIWEAPFDFHPGGEILLVKCSSFFGTETERAKIGGK